MPQSTSDAPRRPALRGFAAMDAERRREIARKGGKIVPDEKRSFTQDRTLAAEAGHAQELDERLQATEGRLAVKEAVVGDYLAHRTTFAHVVEEFRRLNEENANIAPLVRVYYPTADDREVAARNAYNFIAAAAAQDLSPRRRLLSQLRAEIDRQFARPAG